GGLFMSEQIEKRKNENPDQIDKVPEQSRNFHAIGQVFRIPLIKSLANGKPHVNEDQHASEHVETVQSGNGEVTREIGVVPRSERVHPLDIVLFNRTDLIRWRNIEEVRSIHRRIVRIGIHWIQSNLVFLDVRIFKRFGIVEMSGDLEPRGQSLFGEAMVAKIRLIFFERRRFYVSAKMLELLRPFISEFDDEKDNAAGNGREHVP